MYIFSGKVGTSSHGRGSVAHHYDPHNRTLTVLALQYACMCLVKSLKQISINDSIADNLSTPSGDGEPLDPAGMRGSSSSSAAGNNTGGEASTGEANTADLEAAAGGPGAGEATNGVDAQGFEGSEAPPGGGFGRLLVVLVIRVLVLLPLLLPMMMLFLLVALLLLLVALAAGITVEALV